MDTSENRDTSAGPNAELLDDVLPLPPGDQPVTVYVKRIVNNLAAFALNPDAPAEKWFSGGVWWEAATNSDNALFIKFAFISDVSYIDCDPPLLYGPVYGLESAEQDCAVPPLPSGRTKPVVYSFTVYFPDEGSHDPKIVVTPLPGDGEYGGPSDRPRRRRRDRGRAD